MLGKQISQHGQAVVLRRTNGIGAAAPYFDAEIRAIVRNYDSAAIGQGVSRVVVNPADLERLSWPAALPDAKAVDLLPRKGDTIRIGDRWRALTKNAEPVLIGEIAVRLNLTVEG